MEEATGRRSSWTFVLLFFSQLLWSGGEKKIAARGGEKFRRRIEFPTSCQHSHLQLDLPTPSVSPLVFAMSRTAASTVAPRREYTREGYLKNDAFIDDDEDDEIQGSEEALVQLRALIHRAHRERRIRAVGYARLATRQQRERIARGLPADEEAAASESVSSDESDASNSE